MTGVTGGAGQSETIWYSVNRDREIEGRRSTDRGEKKKKKKGRKKKKKEEKKRGRKKKGERGGKERIGGRACKARERRDDRVRRNVVVQVFFLIFPILIVGYLSSRLHLHFKY